MTRGGARNEPFVAIDWTGMEGVRQGVTGLFSQCGLDNVDFRMLRSLRHSGVSIQHSPTFRSGSS